MSAATGTKVGSAWAGAADGERRRREGRGGHAGEEPANRHRVVPFLGCVPWWVVQGHFGYIRLGSRRMTTSVVGQATAITTGVVTTHTRAAPPLPGGDDPEGQRQEQAQAQRQERQTAPAPWPSPAPDQGPRGAGPRGCRSAFVGLGVDVDDPAGGQRRQPGAARLAADQDQPRGAVRSRLRQRVAGTAYADDAEARRPCAVTTLIWSPRPELADPGEGGAVRAARPKTTEVPTWPGSTVLRRCPGPSSRSPEAVPSTTTWSSADVRDRERRDRVADLGHRADRGGGGGELAAELRVERVLAARSWARPPRKSIWRDHPARDQAAHDRRGGDHRPAPAGSGSGGSTGRPASATCGRALGDGASSTASAQAASRSRLAATALTSDAEQQRQEPLGDRRGDGSRWRHRHDARASAVFVVPCRPCRLARALAVVAWATGSGAGRLDRR